ncbi:MAG: UDP-N-acetylmuramate--L-alanine ligase [Oscillospiraceae bacterium]|nr:UDP-N-acetylmuramate--L-alanine ligase [Oscillospiraceae bacterium]
MALQHRPDAYLVPGKHIHLVGIGGVSMRPLGLVLRGMGMLVTGSDMNASVSTDELMSKGIHVHIGHRAENIEGADCVIRTAAARNDNPEIAAARAAGVPVFERAQAWGVLMREYKNALCIAGTHGKTTTSSMATHIFMEAQKDPTVMIGGSLPLLGAGHRVGQGETIIMESCEYCNSFLNFYPTVAVINNIEADHLDFFKDLEDVQNSFRRFACLVPQTGFVIANGDDENTVKALEGLPYLSFGLEQGRDFRAENISESYSSFDILAKGKLYCHVDLAVNGKHNVYNALAAAASAYVMGIEGEAVSKGLASFTGAGRRMEKKGTCKGADVYDDYAHHPSELHSLLEAVKLRGYKRVVLAFQPHTYSRTKALFAEFVQELKGADVLVLAEIYAAREQNVYGISSADLAAEIPNARYFETLPEVTEYLRSIAQEGDLILTVGAGDIVKAGEALVE